MEVKLKASLALVCAAALGWVGELPAASSTGRSNSTMVFVDTASHSFWRTAMSSTVRLPIDYPSGAKSATLTVTGAGYSRVYTEITGDTFDLELPSAAQTANENVYALTLTFNDGTERTARLGCVKGGADASQASACCVLPRDGTKWVRMEEHPVIPIPYGTTRFEVDGVAVDTGLEDGAQGWAVLGPYATGATASLELVAGGDDWIANLVCRPFGGLLLLFR